MTFFFSLLYWGFVGFHDESVETVIFRSEFFFPFYFLVHCCFPSMYLLCHLGMKNLSLSPMYLDRLISKPEEFFESNARNSWLVSTFEIQIAQNNFHLVLWPSCYYLGPTRRDQARTQEHGDLRGSAFGLRPRGRRENLLCNQKRGVHHRDS